ncbi:hypothetical protein HW555_013971 [Spodoptera exigua]|uniref:MADF domain-containing protein n=1 Tax=Spodoptera exigua TaxID=7107 RepID=A0A835KXM8_SPOEX|nr:hypothetical protein HW555_013971 [Spodoptera exigua]
MSIVWNNETELAFIDCYRAEPVLWDINLKDYKNKLKQHDAWMRVSTVMEIPIEELKKKKDSLMSSYRSYKGKVKKSIQSGAGADDIYQPTWFAFEAMNAFLGDNLTCKKTMNTETGEEPTEAIEENDINENRSQSMNSQKDSDHSIRRRKTSSELVEAGNVVKEALATFKSTLKRNPSQPVQQEDDCDLYGKLLANKLRKLSEKNKLQLMHDIDGLYLRYKCDDTVMSPSPPQRPGTSSSTYSESPLHYGQANQNTHYQNRQAVMSPSPPQRPGTSSSTHSEPPLHYGQANQNAHYQNRQVLSAPASNIIIRSHQLVRAPDYPVLHIPENQGENTSNENFGNIIQSAFDSS